MFNDVISIAFMVIIAIPVAYLMFRGIYLIGLELVGAGLSLFLYDTGYPLLLALLPIPLSLAADFIIVMWIMKHKKKSRFGEWGIRMLLSDR